MQKLVFVFDADDTLWQNEWQYSEAQTKFFAYLYEIFQHRMPNLHYVKDSYFRLDGKDFKTWGIKRGRVAHSMLACYEEISQFVKWKCNYKFPESHIKRHRNKIRKIGDLPFDFSKLQWRPDALILLEDLKHRGHTLCLLSSYDTEHFPERTRVMDTGRFFAPEHTRATNFKKIVDDFIAVSGWDSARDKEHAWFAVGNSASDIMPALGISDRWKGFYIPHGSTSKYLEHGKEPNAHPVPFCHYMPPAIEDIRVTTIHTLNEILHTLYLGYRPE